MDGKARFAEISFTGKSGMRITPLADFPRERIDRVFLAAPESGVLVTGGGLMYHVADTVSKKTKSFMPRWGWQFRETIPVILDPENGIVDFKYVATDGYKEQPYYNVIYDVKNDRVLYESPEEGEDIYLDFSLTPELVMGVKKDKEGARETVFYNWRTKEITRNELTRLLTGSGIWGIRTWGRNINPSERYWFARLPVPGELHAKNVKVTWDENYEDVKVIPLDYLIPPEGEWLSDFNISADGKWAASFIGGYEGYYGKLLYKRVFFHLDSRYPNGISMPVFTDEYYKNSKTYESFVEHPEYGLCFAGENYLEDNNGKRKLYLRLYRIN